MNAHDALDGDGGFTGVVERNGGNEVMADMGTDDIVEEMGIDEAKVTINGSSGTTSECPCRVFVMGKGGVGVLKEGYCHYG